MSTLSEIRASRFPVMPCLCGSMRRATRALTQVYERELARFGLSATQMTVLQLLSRAGEVRQGQIGEMLAMDSTSLTRTVSIMRREGWLDLRRGKDRRERWIRLSRRGAGKLQKAEPVWERVQSRMQDGLGGQDWNQLMQLAYRATEIAKRGEGQ